MSAAAPPDEGDSIPVAAVAQTFLATENAGYRDRVDKLERDNAAQRERAAAAEAL